MREVIAHVQENTLDVNPKIIRNILDEYFLRWKDEIPDELLIDRLAKSAKEREIKYIRSHFSRYVETLRVVPKTPRKLKVLDIGIASGHLAILVKKLFNYQVFGIDKKRPETNYWKKRFDGEGIEFRLCDLEKDPIPFEDEYFDIVLFCEVLEHLSNQAGRITLKEINRVLKQGGTLILTTPNGAGLGTRLGFTMSVGHFREYTGSECIRLFEENGFKIENMYYRNFYTNAYKYLLSYKLLFLLYKIIPNLGNCIVTKASKNV
jgi:SAM-dependent methyltransferase